MNDEYQQPYLPPTQPAMIRATLRALYEARIHNVQVPVWKDNQVAWRDAEDVENEVREYLAKVGKGEDRYPL